MNFSFKLGKVVIPVNPEMGMDITIEGLEVAVSDYSIKEGLEVCKAAPGILRELKAVVEEVPAAGKVEEVEEDMVDDILKQMGAKVANHPIFGKGMAVPTSLITEAFMKSMQEKEEKQGEHPLAGLMKDLNKLKANKNPLEAFFNGEIDFGTLGKKLDKEI